MAEEIYDYTVRCHTCRNRFTVQLFDSHAKNLFMVDKKEWYCEKCKKERLRKQAVELTKAHQAIGLPELAGTPKMISWAVKIRADLINKVDYLKKSLTLENDDARELSSKAFDLFFKEWQAKNEAKWWIDNRTMTVRDISQRIKEISDSLKSIT